MTVSELINKLSELEYQKAEICIRGNNSFIVDINEIADCTETGGGGCYVLNDGENISFEKAQKDLVEYCNNNKKMP